MSAGAPGPDGERQARLERLSALADGESPRARAGQVRIDPAPDWQAATRDFARDPLLRQRWHRYQLIGEVLRAQPPLADPAGDAQFLARLRARLAAEPPRRMDGDTKAPAPAAGGDDVAPWVGRLWPQPTAGAPLQPALDGPAVEAFGREGLPAGVAPGWVGPRHWATPLAVAAGVVVVVGSALVLRLDEFGRDTVTAEGAPVATVAVAAAPTSRPAQAPVPGSTTGAAAAAQMVEVVEAVLDIAAAPGADDVRPVPLRELETYVAAHRRLSLVGGGMQRMGLSITPAEDGRRARALP